MSMSDPIADMLTRIRNASASRHKTVDIPASTVKKAIAGILLEEGYIRGFEMVGDGVQKSIRVTLKYGRTKTEKVITGIRRISKPGLRVYSSSNDMPKVLNGMGIAIVSTNKGIITDRQARKEGVGGEVLAFVW